MPGSDHISGARLSRAGACPGRGARLWHLLLVLLAGAGGCGREPGLMERVSALHSGSPFEVSFTAWPAASGCTLERDLVEPGAAICRPGSPQPVPPSLVSEILRRRGADDAEAHRAGALVELLVLEQGAIPYRALSSLRDLVSRAPDDASVRADLAAALVVAARSAGRPELAVEALDEAERAIEIDPGDPHAGAVREAARRLLHLTAAPFATDTREAISTESVLAVLYDPASAARPSERLARARALAARVRDPSLDRILSTVGTELRRTGAGSGAELMRALTTWGEGRRHLEAFRIDAARESFERARTTLSRLLPDLAGWLRFDLLLCDYQERRYDDVLAGMEELFTPASGEDSPWLLSRTLHIRSLLRVIRGEYAAALRLRIAQLATLHDYGEPLLLAQPRRALAGIYDRIGDSTLGWRHLQSALGDAAHLRPLTAGIVWYTAAEWADRAGLVRAGSHFLNAYLAAARATDNPAMLAGALRDAAAHHQHRGRPAEAEQALLDAERQANRVGDSPVHATLLADIALQRAEIRMVTASDQLVPEDLEQLRAFYAERGALRSALRVDRVALRALRSGDDPARLDEVLQRAIGLVAASVAEQTDPVMRDRYGGAMQELFDEIVGYQWEARAPPTDVLRSRERLATSRWSGVEAPADLPGSELFGTLADGSARVFVNLVALPHRMVQLVIDDEEVSMTSTEISRETVQTQTNHLREALLAGDTTAATRHGALLFEWLLSPVRERLAGSTELVLAVDRSLQGVPFAALVDGSSGRYLVQDHRIVLTPGLFFHEQAHLRQQGSGREGAVVVAGDARGAISPLFLEPLGSVEREVAAFLDRHPGAQTLLGESASRENLLAAIERARIFHFAGHAVSQGETPHLSWLATAGNRPGEAGMLFAAEIASLDARHLQLVVLAACRTVGAAASPSGLLGLAEAFLVAGAPAVVGSLWDVEDSATAVFFADFHARIAAGVGPARALRESQLEALARPGSNPAHWAAFQFYGAERPEGGGNSPPASSLPEEAVVPMPGGTP